MYSEGDLIKVLGENDAGEREHWYAEVVGVLSSDRKLEVYYLEPGLDRVYRFSKDWYEISFDSVEEHVSVHSRSRKSYLDAWSSLGFVAGGDGESFCLKEDESTVTLPLGDYDTDDEEDVEGRDDLNGYISDGGFVVPDDEEFTFADPSSTYVQETHQAVRDYETWNPQEPAKKKVKRFIDKAQAKANHIESEKAFVNAKPALSTHQPPLNNK